MEHEQQNITLPTSIVGRMDVGRIIREMGALDQFLEQSKIQFPNQSPKLPKTSKMLDEIIQLNKLDVLDDSQRKNLIGFMTNVRTSAPTVHMSFSADPSALFTQRIVTYLRQSIHSQVLLQIGLQPNIGAGCMLRTSNKYFDFSLKQRFEGQHALLMSKLQEGSTFGIPETVEVTNE